MKKVIKDFPNYSVDSSGSIYNKHGKVVGSNGRSSNATVCLTKEGKVHTFLIKVIVAEHFLTKPSEFHNTVCYKTDNDKDNSADNITWCISASEIKLRDLIGSRFEKLVVREVTWFCRLDNQVVNTALVCECDCGSVVTLKKCELEKKLKHCNCDRKQNLIELREKAKAQEIELNKYGWRVTSDFNIEQKFNTLVCEKLHKPKINIEKWNKLSPDKKSTCPDCVKALEKSKTWENINRLQFEAIEKGFVVSAYTSRAIHIKCENDHLNKIVFSGCVDDKCQKCEDIKAKEYLILKEQKVFEDILSKSNYGNVIFTSRNSITYQCNGCSKILEAGKEALETIKEKGLDECFVCKLNNEAKQEGYKILSEIKYGKDQIIVECPYKEQFTTTPNLWLRYGQRCPKCRKRKNVNDFSNELKLEGYKLIGEYKNRRTKVLTLCPQGHEWNVQRADWKKGVRCSLCSGGGGFNFDKPGLLYYLKVKLNNRYLYKIGITNKSVKVRYKGEKARYEVLMEQWYENGQEAFDQEQSILQEYQRYRYTGDKVLTCGGNTELFVIDVLGLDSKVETSMSA